MNLECGTQKLTALAANGVVAQVHKNQLGSAGLGEHLREAHIRQSIVTQHKSGNRAIVCH